MTAPYPEPDFSASPEEREALRTLAPVRATLERITRKTLERAGGGELDPLQLRIAVEAHWTLILEGYRRGVRMVHRGLHRAEGLDHALVDQAVDFALRELLEDDREQRERRPK